MDSLAVCSNSRMSTVQDNWLANLRALVDSHAEGADKRPGFRLVAQTAGLSEEYIYQLYEAKPKADGSPRLVGPRAAKSLARAFANGRPHDWFDKAPGSHIEPLSGDTGSMPENMLVLSAEEHQLLSAYRELLPEDRESLTKDLYAKAEQMRRHTEMVLAKAGVKFKPSNDRGNWLPVAPPYTGPERRISKQPHEQERRHEFQHGNSFPVDGSPEGGMVQLPHGGKREAK